MPLQNEFYNAMLLGRIAILDELVRMHDACSTGCYRTQYSADGGLLTKLIDRRFCRSVDWNPVLQHYNEKMDRVAYAISLKDFKKGIPMLWLDYRGVGWRDPKIQVYRANQVRLQDSSFRSLLSSHGNAVDGVPLWSLPVADCYVAAHECLFYRRLFQIAARLSVWHHRHGTWPDRLADLTDLPEFASAPSKLFIDPFSGREFPYCSTELGFELRSAAVDAKFDNGGRLMFSGVHVGADDGDDFILQWPESP